jgi:hypothetical protein|tara:strand:+ start:255 stop:392 length:138 start_codon:yes stop_codon:yes gene_type:complete
MAKLKLDIAPLNRIKKKTSIGSSINSRPRSKQAKISFKKYRGQGR